MSDLANLTSERSNDKYRAIIGFGDKIDKTKSTTLKAGDVAFIPAHTHEYAWSTGEVIFQLTAIGPRKIFYVNPAEMESLRSLCM